MICHYRNEECCGKDCPFYDNGFCYYEDMKGDRYYLQDNRPLQVKIKKKDLIRAFRSENNFNKYINELIEKMLNKQ